MTGVHFIEIYGLVYQISGMRNFCSVERSQLVPIKLVHRVQITEIVQLSILHNVGEIAW